MGFPFFGAALGLGALGSLFGGLGGKSRSDFMQKLFEQQRDYQRGRFGETEALGQSQMNQTGALMRRAQERDYSAVGAARNLAAGQLNKTGQYFKDRIGQVQGAINQVGQTARRDILDQGRQGAAAAQRGLVGRGLGSSTLLAGAQAQQREATNRGLSSLAEGIAGVRGGALERTTGDLANFMQFRSQYEPGLVMGGRQFTREGDRGLANFMQGRTMFETGLKDQHTQADSSLFSNLINAAAGGKGAMAGTIGNTLGGIGNNLLLWSLLGGGS